MFPISLQSVMDEGHLGTCSVPASTEEALTEATLPLRDTV